MSKNECCCCCKICECKCKDADQYVHDPNFKVPFATKLYGVVALITFIAWCVSFFVYASGDGFVYGFVALIVETVIYMIFGLRQAYK